jgi:protein-L-isoaspartate(D-aspartate) O-methyltransferase
MVAMSIEALRLEGDETVLEVGAGSGYQAAVLSKLAKKVVAIENIPELAASARRVLGSLGIDNVEIICADGRKGWPADAPYDGIVVAAAAEEVPPALIEQLKEGGRLVIPVGGGWGQSLQTSRKRGDVLETEELCRCVFVPLVHGS